MLRQIIGAAVLVAVATWIWGRAPGGEPPDPRTTLIHSPPVFIQDWERGIEIGRPVFGQADAPVRMIVLYDFGCMASRDFHRSLRSLDPERVRVYLVHFPLEYHERYLPAARIAGCAWTVSPEVFRTWVDGAFDHWEMLGRAPWEDLLASSGLDGVQEPLARCGEDDAGVPAIEAGMQFGVEIEAHGTPTIVIEGWKLPGTPEPAALRMLVASFAVGADPFEPTRRDLP